MEEISEYKSYKIITLREDPPANCLWINGTILHLPSELRYEDSIRVKILFLFSIVYMISIV